MSVKELLIDCDCKVSVCAHAYKKVGELLQSGYDDGYDEGWNDAFVFIKNTMVDMGLEKASNMEAPLPPPRAGSRNKIGHRTRKNELLN